MATLDPFTPTTAPPRHILTTTLGVVGIQHQHAPTLPAYQQADCDRLDVALKAFMRATPDPFPTEPTGRFWVSVGEDGNLEIGSRVP